MYALSSIFLQILGRRKAQTVMVKLGIMEWICEQLLAGKGATAASEYSIQYGSALLMNLALRSVGRRRSETFSILPVLSRMLEFPNEQVRIRLSFPPPLWLNVSKCAFFLSSCAFFPFLVHGASTFLNLTRMSDFVCFACV